DFGHIQVQVTYDDAETLVKPLTISLGLIYAADTDLLEYVCNENEKDTPHLVGTAKVVLRVPASVLAKYGGAYKYREGPPAAATFFGRTQIVSVNQGQLYMKDFPLVPQTETRFDSTAGTIEFFLDASGKVTHLILSAAEGDLTYDRKPECYLRGEVGRSQGEADAHSQNLPETMCRRLCGNAGSEDRLRRCRLHARADRCGAGQAARGHHRRPPRQDRRRSRAYVRARGLG